MLKMLFWHKIIFFTPEQHILLDSVKFKALFLVKMQEIWKYIFDTFLRKCKLFAMSWLEVSIL